MRDATARQLTQRLRAPDFIAAPITESGTVVGLIAVTHRLGEMNEFRQQDGSMFATLAVHASVALENGRLIARLHEQARQREHESQHDALTGLPNRVLFGERLRAAVAGLGDGDTLAVALMDLDGFKEVNDTLGHHAGDEVLIEVAHRLVRSLQPAPFVARLGGDEFAAIFPAGYDLAQLEQCGRTIRTELSMPMPIEGVRVTLGISIGLAVAPRDGSDASTLLQRADVAMYAAKTGIGDGVCFYDAGADTNTPRRLALSSDLPGAIEHGEIELRFQPKVRLADGAVIGTEALARWRHPRYGFVAPDEFIPIAERGGSILRLTEFVLASAVRQAAHWQWSGRHWGVAVNLSMRNLLDVDLVSTVARLLDGSGLAPELLTLEITETNVMSDAARTIDLFERLAALGIRLSIDDFGTGYSSLSYLQRLPVDEVKVDQVFVRQMVADTNADAIVRSVLDLAGHMGLSVVAEGVEDRETWDRLRSLGCAEAQGYFLARPMPASEVIDWASQLERLHLVDPVLPASVSA